MAKKYQLHEYCPDDELSILELNTESVVETSPMDSAKFQTLLSQGCRVTVAIQDKQVFAFLMEFPEGSDYDNANYHWFSERLKRFIYVDRIVVGKAARGDGVGQLIYSDLIQRAQGEKRLWIAAEINTLPRNEPSLVFHNKQGFVEVGQQKLHAQKIVSMQVRAVN